MKTEDDAMGRLGLILMKDGARDAEVDANRVRQGIQAQEGVARLLGGPVPDARWGYH